MFTVQPIDCDEVYNLLTTEMTVETLLCFPPWFFTLQV
jgi:hypothetical protein